MAITVQTKTGVFEIDADTGETILFTGLAAGLSLPYECATGTCGTCRARVMEGETEVLWPEAPGGAKLKRDKGDILMCQTRATGPCVLRVPADVTLNLAGRIKPERLSAVVTSTERLTSDVMHFDVELPREIAFDAGQFFVVTAPGLRGARAYSMVNYAPSTNTLSFVIKRKPGGGFSKWAFENDMNGTELSLFGPLGQATFRPEENFDLVCITGGSGIAGIMSILNHASDIGYFKDRTGQLYFGVRTLADGFYLNELQDMIARSNGALSVTLALSNEDPPADAHPEYPGIRLSGGFVHDVASAAMEGASDNAIGFVAGPPPMVDGAIRILLTKGGLAPGRIRYDKFN